MVDGRADRRPRIHLWPAGDRCAWSRGPCGVRSAGLRTPGHALDHALSIIGRKPVVIFLEPENV